LTLSGSAAAQTQISIGPSTQFVQMDATTPTKVGPGIGDIVPGIMLGFGVLAAIHHARRTGQGQFVDVSMVDAVLAVCERMVWQHSVQGLRPGPEGNHHPFLCPFGMFSASDGFVTIAAQQDGEERAASELARLIRLDLMQALAGQ